MLDLAAVFLAGLLGSAHCVGMCGGFVALLSVGDGRSVVARQVAYFGGKTLTYTAFGALAGAAGFALREVFSGVGGVVSVGIGVMMIVAGLAVCGVAWGRGTTSARLAGHLAPVVGRVVHSDRPGALVALGAINGLLPCGLVYALLAVAATSGSAGRGALTMVVFGLATVPALALVGTLGVRLRPARRLALQRLAGVLVVAMGMLTVARGAHALSASPEAHGAHTDVLCVAR